jgi:DtxR family Mn-dependent transcriptional regulator
MGGESKGKGFHTVRGYELLTDDMNPLTSAMEDYLEMIYRSCVSEGFARVNKLAELLNVQASSATKMVRKLADAGYVNYERYGIVRLTEKGTGAGSFLLDRHRTIETFLKNLGVKNNVLRQTELIEHDISTETLDKIRKLNAFLEKEPGLMEKIKTVLS